MKLNKNGTSKLKMMILSLIFAIIAWAGIIYINPPELTTTVTNLPVRLSGEVQLKEKGLAVVGRSEISGLAVTVKGKRNDLMNLSKDIYVDVDVSAIEQSGDYNVNGNVTVPSSRITIEDVKFDSVPITVDTLGTKDISIEISQTGTVVGKLIESVSNVKSVTLTGAESELEQVEYGLITVDVSGMVSDISQEYNYVLMNDNNSLISKNETIEASVTRCYVESEIYDEVTLPINITLSDSLAKEYKLSQSSTVSPSSAVVGVKDISKAPKALTVTVDKNAAETEVEINPAEGVYIPETQKKVKVKPVLDKKLTRAVKVKPSVRNIPEGFTAEAETINVNATGTDADLTADNITAYVDLSSYAEAGTYAVPAVVQSDTVAVEGEYSANVVISAAGNN